MIVFQILKHLLLFLVFNMLGIIIVFGPFTDFKSLFHIFGFSFIVSIGLTCIPYLIAIGIIKYFKFSSLWAYALGGTTIPLLLYIILCRFSNPYKFSVFEVSVFVTVIMIMPYVIAITACKMIEGSGFYSFIIAILTQLICFGILFYFDKLPLIEIIYLWLTGTLLGVLYGILDKKIAKMKVFISS